MVALAEAEERETSQKEFDKRRTRLNAGPPEQLKKDITLEFLGNSKVLIPCSHPIANMSR